MVIEDNDADRHTPNNNNNQNNRHHEVKRKQDKENNDSNSPTNPAPKRRQAPVLTNEYIQQFLEGYEIVYDGKIIPVENVLFAASSSSSASSSSQEASTSASSSSSSSSYERHVCLHCGKPKKTVDVSQSNVVVISLSQLRSIIVNAFAAC